MLALIARMKVKTGKEEEFERVMGQLAAQVRSQETGCHLYVMCKGREPGEYVMQINGKDVALNEKLWDVLNDQSGRDLELLVNKTPSKEGARKVKYRAITSGAWGQLRYAEWVEKNRKYVEEKSGGKVGYVHIAGMGGGNRTTFNEEFFEYK